MAGLGRGGGERPLYAQLAAALEEQVASGALRPGERLPGDHELVATYGVSRATVTKALDNLVRRGVVVREQGRGTFVGRLPMERRLPELTGFSEHIHGLGMRPHQQLLSLEQVRASDETDPVLAPFGDADLVVIRRLRLVDDKPAGVHRVAVPADVAEQAGLDADAFAGPDVSLYALLGAAGVTLNAAHESLRAVNADAESAKLLDLPRGAALIEVLRSSVDPTGRLVEVVQAHYNGAMYVYHVDLAKPDPSSYKAGNDDTSTSDRPQQRSGGRSVGLTARHGLRREH